MPKVSIIVPVYNVEKYLQRCLESLVNQTLADLEFICINDGSTDASLEILNKYAEKDPRFVIINQKNQSSGAARNNGLKYAKGKYIAYVDPDDWIELDAMEVLYKKAEETNAEVVLFNFNIVSDMSTIHFSYLDAFKANVSYDLNSTSFFKYRDMGENVFKILAGIWDKFYRKDFLEKHNIHFSPTYRSDDGLFVLMVVYYAEKMCYLNKNLYNYYMRSDSTMSKFTPKHFTSFDAKRDVIDFVKTYMPDWQSVYIEGIIIGLVNAYKGLQFWDFCTRRKYNKKCSELLGENDYKKYLQHIRKERPLWKDMCSIQRVNDRGIRYKKISVLGYSFKIEKRPKIKK